MQALNKKGFNLNSILPIALVFIVTGIAIAYGLQVLGDIRDDTVDNTFRCGTNSTGGTGNVLLYDRCDGYLATNQTVTAVAKFPAKMGLLATVVIAAIVLVILVKYLGGSVR